MSRLRALRPSLSPSPPAKVLAVLLAVVSSALLSGCFLPERQAGDKSLYQVEEVIDGDTFRIPGGEKVRLIGIDAPETPHSYKQRNFHYGKEADRYLRKLIEGREVALEFDVEQRDRYGRLLAYAYLADTLFLNAHLVREGYARAATFPPNVKYSDLFRSLEQEARKERRGLWKK